MTPDQDAVLRQHLHQTLAFTGHRPDKVAAYERAIRLHMLTSMMLMEPASVISGMALGVDTWAAECALALAIPLVAAVPFKGQDQLWPAALRRHYDTILERAVGVRVVCEGDYHPSKMQARNEWMVDRCGLLLAYWNGSSGGTANCVHYARRVKRDRIEVDPTALD